MKSAVSIAHMDGVLYATFTGEKSTAQEILYHTQNAVNAAKRHQCDRVLMVINITALHGVVSVSHLTLVAGLLGSLPQGTRVAYNRHDAQAHHKSKPSLAALHFVFLMGAAKAHGVEVRAFESIHDAREWLGLAATDTAREQQDSQAEHASQPSALRHARDRRNALLAQAKRAQ